MICARQGFLCGRTGLASIGDRGANSLERSSIPIWRERAYSVANGVSSGLPSSSNRQPRQAQMRNVPSCRTRSVRRHAPSDEAMSEKVTGVRRE